MHIKPCIHACTYIHVLYHILHHHLKLELTGSIIHQKMSRQVSRRTNCKSRTRISPRRPSHHQHQTHHFSTHYYTQGLDSITKRHFTMMRRRRRGMRMMLINIKTLTCSLSVHTFPPFRTIRTSCHDIPIKNLGRILSSHLTSLVYVQQI